MPWQVLLEVVEQLSAGRSAAARGALCRLTAARLRDPAVTGLPAGLLPRVVAVLAAFLRWAIRASDHRVSAAGITAPGSCESRCVTWGTSRCHMSKSCQQVYICTYRFELAVVLSIASLWAHPHENT